MKSSLTQPVIEAIANNPKSAIIIPSVTAVIAPLSEIAQIQGYLSIASMCVGICISMLLLRHWWIKNSIAEIELDQLKKDTKNGS